jgi:hypothetical protein
MDLAIREAEKWLSTALASALSIGHEGIESLDGGIFEPWSFAHLDLVSG